MTKGKLLFRGIAIAAAMSAVCWASAADAHDGVGFRRGFRQRFLGGAHGGIGLRRSFARSFAPGLAGVGFQPASCGALDMGFGFPGIGGAGFGYDPFALGGISTLDYGGFGGGAAGFGSIGFNQPVFVQQPVFVPMRQQFFGRRFFGRRGFGFGNRGFFGHRGSLRRSLGFGF